ncbi:CopD family protein [Mitsuaria sp. GD03876]|uniref:CopD family protein n=1 Tax=Mitsuaria sp. GD03876 TaxID=2975399 RepID=UPI00244844BA|nr:CopD family protein [Mitsuaria sp. GD03876]MDH0867655.1 CopD family protein [Mitsuaria sp. GD03876]
MSYLWIKGLHLAAVLTWVGGLLLLGVAAAAMRPARDAVLLPHEKRIGTAVLQWDRRVTTPAMLAAWALGIGLATWGGWFGALWLNAKLPIVVLLSGLHGMLSATLRRPLDQAGEAGPGWLRLAPAMAIAGLCAIAILAVVKP